MATDRPDAQERSAAAGRLAGFVIVVIVPTIFWTALLFVITWACDRPLSFGTASLISAMLFAFLGCIWASFAMADKHPPGGE